MDKAQELKLNRIIKELSNILAASGGGGGGGGNTIETKLLINPNDPSDETRRVLFITDTTNPAIPVHTYLHVDDGTPFVGDISELQSIDYPAELEIYQQLVEITELLENTIPVYYMEWDREPTLPIDIIANVVINFKSNSNGVMIADAWSDSGALTATYPTMSDMFDAFNSAQPYVELYELSDEELIRLDINKYVLGIRTNNLLVPDGVLYIDLQLDSATLKGGIKELTIHDTALDEIRNLLKAGFNSVVNINELGYEALINLLSDNVPYENRVARGDINNTHIVQISGYNNDIDNGTVPETIWSYGGVYTGFTDIPEPLRIRAGGSVDDGPAGTGALSILISGLDELGNRLEETLDTAGVSASGITVNNYKRANYFEVVNAGTGKKNAGVIIIEGATSGIIYGSIPIGINNSQLCVYTVPVGFQFEVSRISITTYGTSATDVELAIMSDTGGNGIFRTLTTLKIDQTSRDMFRDYKTLVFNSLDDIKIECISCTNSNFACSAEIFGIITQV